MSNQREGRRESQAVKFALNAVGAVWALAEVLFWVVGRLCAGVGLLVLVVWLLIEVAA